MDTEWALGVLESWIEDASRARQNAAYSMEPSPWASRYSRAVDALREREDQAAHVIQRALCLPTLPSLLIVANDDEVEVQAGIDFAARARGRILTQAETTAKLGSSAPSMKADELHPLVWGAASKRWDSRHYTDAVQRAATAHSGLVKDQTGRYELADNDLMSQAFSSNPPQEGKPRLRWPGKDDDLTVRAMRQGILHVAQGVFSAIRNPATHSTHELSRQDALEQLATLSVLARWIDHCVLVEASTHV